MEIVVELLAYMMPWRAAKTHRWLGRVALVCGGFVLSGLAVYLLLATFAG